MLNKNLITNKDGQQAPRLFVPFINNYLKSANHIFDVGCGNLQYTRNFGKNAIYGIDILAPKINLNDYPKVNFESGDLCDENTYAHIPVNFFDIATCFDVIEHVLEPEILMKQAHNKMMNDGTLLVSTPNYGEITFRLKWLFGRPIENYNAQHIRLFNFSLAKQLFEDSGFKIHKVRVYLSRVRGIWRLLHLWPFNKSYKLASLFGANFLFILKKEQHR